MRRRRTRKRPTQATDQPTGTTPGRSAGEPTTKTPGRSAGESTKKATGKTGGRATRRKAKTPAGTATAKPTGTPTATATSRTASKPSGQRSEQRAEPPSRKRSDKRRGQRQGKGKSQGQGQGQGRRTRRPSHAIPTDQGVASRRQRGTFVESWWAERWVTALERLVAQARLARGQAYARAGQVLSVQEQDGMVVAQVQGSRRTPYRVTIGLTPLSDRAWQRVVSALAERPDLAASLLAGEMPRDIDEIFATARAALFPASPEHLRLTCSCPDPATVCKHIAATCYLVGEQLDEDPFLLFRLRGRGQDALLEGLRRRAGASTDADAGDASTPASSANASTAPPATDATPLDAEGFWTVAGAVPRIDLPSERPDLSLLRRLGPFSALEDDLVTRLGPVYRAVASAAEAALDAADAEPPRDDEGGR